jgi:hypothetical protein
MPKPVFFCAAVFNSRFQPFKSPFT